MKAALLANGETPAGAALEELRAADVLVACDGALGRARACGREPDFVVGDGDSLGTDGIAALGERFVLVAEQETNDLEKAFRFACGRWPGAEIVILGAGGGREDHLIGNVFRMTSFSEACPDVTMITNAGRFDVADGERRFPCRPGEAVSVFAPYPGTKAVSKGLEWPLEGVDLSRLWSATLNRAARTSFSLEVTHPVIVYRAW